MLSGIRKNGIVERSHQQAHPVIYKITTMAYPDLYEDHMIDIGEGKST